MRACLRLVLVALCIAGCASPSQTSSGGAEEKRTALRQMRDTSLQEFYATKAGLEEEVRAAVGYGVFDGSQTNLVLYVGAVGAGVVVDNKDGAETFMTMVRAGTGPGIGYKKYRQLLVFKDRTVFDTFRTLGADVGASADATLKVGEGKGLSLDGSKSFNPTLSVYQITDRGALLQANWGGVAYAPDSALNAK
jgi:lipid-binding SYLF domain-containing protein